MHILIIFSFLLVFIAILFFAHWFLYFSLVNFFHLTNNLPKNILIGALIFLGLSFVASSFLSHWNDNIFTRAYYLLSGIWLGILNNLVLVSLLIWLIILAGKFFNLNIDVLILASPVLLIALALSLYGIWNAQNPVLKNITVSIPNLPLEWKGKKIIQLSDVHLGHINREKFARKIIDKINSVDPEMVLITGDLFDGMDGNLAPIVKPLENIHSKKGIFFVTGNHETYLGLDNVFSEIKNTPIKILRDEVLDVDGLKIIGISYSKKDEKKNIITTLKSLQKNYLGSPNILLYHSPTNIDQIKKEGINLELCGHTHVGQIFPFNLVTKLIYHGYDYGIYKSDDYTLYTTNGAGTWGPTMRLGNVPEIVVINLE